MIKREYEQLLKEIRAIYPEFEADERLLDFTYASIKKNFGRHKGKAIPTFEELIKGVDPEDLDKPVILQCEYCKGKELVRDTNEWIDKHRKCQKIDFIDRQSKQIRGIGINRLKYYQMSSYELEKNYRKVMDNYIENIKHQKNQFYEKL